MKPAMPPVSPRLPRRPLLLGAAAAMAVAALPARAQPASPKRTALVIGNGAYALGRLKNPGNDARLVGQSLAASGFQVAQHMDLDMLSMLDRIGRWLEAARSAESRFFFFAGHGAQYRGRNYMMPVDAELASEDDITAAAVNATELADRMSRFPSGVNVVVLDMCRDIGFPLVQRTRRGPVRSGGSIDSRLVPPVPAQGTVIAFSTSPGAQAADGVGDNSIYARHLAALMRQPGLPVETVFKRVRQAVARETGNRQVPWEASSLVGDFCLTPSSSGQCPGPVAPAAGVDLRSLETR